MAEKRAYYTPDLEEIPTFVARILFSDPSEEHSLEFMVDDSTGENSKPELREVIISPITKVSTHREGLEIYGHIPGSETILGKLAINTTVDPPFAVYQELDV